MSNKYPQYLTAKGLERRKKRPTLPSEPIVEEKAAPSKSRLEEIKKRVKQELSEQYKQKEAAQKASISKKDTANNEIRLVTTNAPKINRKRRMVQRSSEENRSISPAAAKAIAEALKSMLHS